MIGPLTRAWLRLFGIQASWNYERMVGLGVGVAMQPLLERLANERGEDARRQALARAAGYFNAHPYLAAFAVGAQARAEIDGVAGEQVDRLRRALVAPLGSMGDRLVWVGWLPATVGLALVAVALGAGWASIVIFLVAYNVLHLWVRTWGLRAGWRLGVQVSQALGHPLLQRALRVMPATAAVLLGAALPLSVVWTASLFPGSRSGMALLAAVGFIVLRWISPAIGGLRLALITVVASLVVEAVWP